MADDRPPPRNLQGLLHFCTELTAKEDASNTSATSMDNEKREFLQKALTSMTTNKAKQIANYLQLLLSSDRIFEPMEDISDEKEALEELADVICDIDDSNDLIKMGGVPVILSCLKSPHSKILELACLSIGNLCQNHEKAQKEVAQHGALQSLLDLVDKDTSVQVRLRALFAVSCLVRGYDPAVADFDKLDGFSILMRTILSDNERLTIKSLFFIESVIHSNPTCIASLVKMGFIELIADILSSYEAKVCDNSDAAETCPDVFRLHCVSTLCALCDNSQDAVGIVAANHLFLSWLVHRHLLTKQNDSYVDEFIALEKLRNILVCSGTLSEKDLKNAHEEYYS